MKDWLIVLFGPLLFILFLVFAVPPLDWAFTSWKTYWEQMK